MTFMFQLGSHLYRTSLCIRKYSRTYHRPIALPETPTGQSSIHSQGALSICGHCQCLCSLIVRAQPSDRWQREHGCSGEQLTTCHFILQSYPFLTTVIDGVLLPKAPEEILAEKNFNTVPYIVGINKQEFGWFIPTVRK